MDRKALATSARRKIPRSVVVLACLCIVLVGVVIRAINAQPKPARGAVSQSSTMPRTSAPAPTSVASELPPVVIDWSSAPSRDLFARPRPPAPAPSVPAPAGPDIPKLRIEAARTVALQAIIVADVPSALINNRLYRTGEQIGGFVLKRIDRRFIVVEREGVELQVNLP